MNTISEQAAGVRRRRRMHSDEFKANAVASCQATGISVAAVALANGPFKTVDDLRNVKGIGPALLSKIAATLVAGP